MVVGLGLVLVLAAGLVLVDPCKSPLKLKPNSTFSIANVSSAHNNSINALSRASEGDFAGLFGKAVFYNCRSEIAVFTGDRLLDKPVG